MDVRFLPHIAALMIVGSVLVAAAAVDHLLFGHFKPELWLERGGVALFLLLVGLFVWLMMRIVLHQAVKEATDKLVRTQGELEMRVKTGTLDLLDINKTLQEREGMLADAQRIGKLGNWVWDITADKFQWSDEVDRIFGYRPGDFEPSYERFLQAVHLDDRDCVVLAMQQALAEKQPYAINHRIVGAEGIERIAHQQAEVILDDSGEVISMRGVVQDITERMEFESRLHHLVYFDAITGLPNRILLRDRLSHALLIAQRSQRLVGLLLLDLDQFKTINDSLGHEAGDKLLILVAERLKSSIRNDDTLARLGGDEFCVILEGLAHSDNIGGIVDKILGLFSSPFMLGEQEVFITASAGVSLYPNDGTDAESLMKNADAAMYRAKELGRNSYQYFSSDMGTRVFERLALETQMRWALDKCEFILYYQPLVDFGSGQICGLEALIRWHHPQMGIISPAHFIPLAEETGMIVAMGDWVLQEVCRQYSAWQDAGINMVPININIAAQQFWQEDFSEHLIQLLNEYGLTPHCLGLEITENTLMKDSVEVNDGLDRLKSSGFQLSIDDFGTGHSSLSYLKRFAIDSLKIDRTFVRDITTESDDEVIVEAIILMAQKLNFKVVAEGIETHEQFELLKASGCNIGQGYLFSEPKPAKEVGAILGSSELLQFSGLSHLTSSL